MKGFLGFIRYFIGKNSRFETTMKAVSLLLTIIAVVTFIILVSNPEKPSSVSFLCFLAFFASIAGIVVNLDLISDEWFDYKKRISE